MSAKLLSKVLLVGDNIDIIELLQVLLQPHAEKFSHALTTRDATNMLIENQPDLVITDIPIFSREGVSFLKWVLNHHPNTPIITLSGSSADVSYITDLTVLSAQFPNLIYLQKPFTTQELMECVGGSERAYYAC